MLRTDLDYARELTPPYLVTLLLIGAAGLVLAQGLDYVVIATSPSPRLLPTARRWWTPCAPPTCATASCTTISTMANTNSTAVTPPSTCGAASGIEAVELGTGNFSSAPHCRLPALLDREAQRRSLLDALAARNLALSALNCSGDIFLAEQGYRGSLSIEYAGSRADAAEGTRRTVQLLKRVMG